MVEYIERGRITEIALSLLAAYEDAKNEYIWETSDSIQEDTDRLEKAVEDKRKEILSIPAADVRSVVCGRWIRGRESMTSPGKDSYTCSACGEKTLSGFCGNPARTNFCPNCGAKMTEAKDDRY